MAEPCDFLAKKRYAVVTGSNKGIGLEICRKLASQGVVVVLTSRDEKRGLEAIQKLKQSGVDFENLHYHQLDVTDSTSVNSLASFISSKFGKLDILVNNAAINGHIADYDALKKAGFGTPGIQTDVMELFIERTIQTPELAEECLRTNYYGAKRITEALLPILELSDSPRIINVTSSAGKLKYIPNARIKEELDDTDSLTEHRVDDILDEFLTDFKNDSLQEKGWPLGAAAYTMSKAALNAYTRILAKRYPPIIINCVCPGFVRTDFGGNMGYFDVEEGAESPARLALMPHGSPSGLFFRRLEISSFHT